MPSSLAAIPTLPYWVTNRRSNWRMLVFGGDATLSDIPEFDVLSIDIEDIENGGSGTGTIVLRRDINNVGAIGYNYTVAIWLWRSAFEHAYADFFPTVAPSQSTFLADPYYLGHVVDIDQEQLLTHGKITIHLEGEAKRLDDALVDLDIYPGAAYGNPNLTATDFLGWLLTNFQPPIFTTPFVTPSLPNLTAAQWDGVELGTVVDDVCKQCRDTFGKLVCWRAVPTFGWDGATTQIARYIAVFGDLNPNVDSSIPLFGLINKADFVDYKIETKYKDIKNVVSAYGGQDPIAQYQIFGVFERADSVGPPNNFGPKEAKISNSYILDAGTLAAWASAWLDLNAYPQAQVSFKMIAPDPNLFAGRWVRIIEAPTTGDVTLGALGVTKDLRISKVNVHIEGERVDQVITTVSPTPYLDRAIYVIGQHAQNKALSAADRQQPPNRMRSYIRYGATISTTSGLMVTLIGGQAVFNNALVTFSSYTHTFVADGIYYVGIDNTGAWWVVGPGAPPNFSQNQLLVHSFQVINGHLFV